MTNMTNCEKCKYSAKRAGLEEIFSEWLNLTRNPYPTYTCEREQNTGTGISSIASILERCVKENGGEKK